MNNIGEKEVSIDALKEIDNDSAGEKEKKIRTHEGWQKKFVYYLTIVISLFHIWFNTIGIMGTVERNAMHMALMASLVFLFYPARAKPSQKSRFGWLDGLLCVLIIGCGLYIVNNFLTIHTVQMSIPSTSDLVVAAMCVLLLLEAARRSSGLVIPAIAIFFSLYTVWFGKYVPGLFHYRGASMERFLFRLTLTDECIFGIVANISSTYVFLFILFGAFLLKSGASAFIVDLARSIARGIRGGPAQVAVISSGLMGSISGSAIANTVTTGSITIPLMKKVGYRPHIAAAVEAAASTGGQLMPPIMGAGAFIMAQWTGFPYVYIIGVAAIPAIMYFLSVAFFVYLRACKQQIALVDSTDLPALKTVLKEGGIFFLPIALLIITLLRGYTPLYAGLVGIVSVVVCSWFSPKNKMGIKDILDALHIGARNAASTAVILMTAGIVVGVAGITGIGVTFSSMIIMLSQGILILALALIAIAAVVLGMGLPVTASYIMVAVVAAPALVELGVPLLAAHMIIFWFSQSANVTPPICLAAYAAAGIAGSEPMKTGLTAMRLAKGLFVIPLLFAYSPLLFTGQVWETIATAFFATFGLFAFSIAFEGYFLRALKYYEQFLFALSCVLLLWPNIYLQGGGMILFAALSFAQKGTIHHQRKSEYAKGS